MATSKALGNVFKLSSIVNVKDPIFGATGDGVTDDTAAIDLAEAAAYAAGAVLLFPSGNTYLYAGSLVLRCSISGYGATIKQTSNADENIAVLAPSANDIMISGITVDADLKSAGIANSSGDRIAYIDCVAKNCLRYGMSIVLSTDSLISRCRAITVHYVTAGTGSADGFYLAGNTNPTVVHCYATDFRRIGFSSEASGSTKSTGARFLSCTATNANNCDDSATEYNAGFWAENTNGVVFDGCVATDIAGNAGQTGGRVRGMTLHGTGDTLKAQAIAVNCTIGDTSGTLPQGIYINGSSGLADVIVDNCFIDTFTVGIVIGGSTDTVTIRDAVVANGAYATASAGGVLIDGTSGSNNKISIANLREVNPTFTSADAGTVNLIATYASGDREMTLQDCKDCSLVLRSTVLKMKVNNCSILKRSATYGCFSTPQLQLDNSEIGFVAGGSTSVILSGFALASAKAYISNTKFTSIAMAVGQTDVEGVFSNCEFSASSITWAGTGTTGPILKMTGCIFTAVPSGGTIIASTGNGTKDTLLIQDCSFYAADVGYVPIKKSSNNPDHVLIHGCNYNTTALTDIVGGTTNSQVNDIQTL